jgi:serine/threonine-protein phosphatase 5
MENETSEKTRLNNNKLENMNENTNDRSKICKDFTKKTLFISFIVLIFIIYLLKLFIFNFPKKYINNYISLIEGQLNKTKAISSTSNPNPLFKVPIFPDDGIITKEWVFELIDSMKDLNNKKSYEERYMDKKYLLKMILKAKNILSEYNESIINIDIPYGKNFTIVGDIHGQFYDLLNIFEINGYPSEDNLYLFNGDYIDRGAFGVETIITLMAFKILYPNHFFMNRGNHEDINVNNRYGFRIEVAFDKYDSEVYDYFSEFFRFLPLGHILNNKIIVIHGGLFSKEGVTINELKNLDRGIDVPTEGLMTELLWSDPRDENGWRPSDRGAGVYFGEDVTEKFLNDNNLTLLIRSHEVKMEGYEIQHSGKTITIFSAPNYNDITGNKGAIIKVIGEEMELNFTKFDAVPHPAYVMKNN